MVDKELIGIWRNMLKLSISSWLLKTNYEGMGEQDKEEFERDFDEILDLALIGLKYKAQHSQEGTTKDTISRQAALEKVRAMQTYKLFMGDDMILVDKAEVQTELMMLPPAQPEIVRCKDCKWWKKQKDSAQGRCELLKMYPAGGWYCANAERRTDD